MSGRRAQSDRCAQGQPGATGQTPADGMFTASQRSAEGELDATRERALPARRVRPRPPRADADVGAVFAALADPTRRHVVSLLAQRPTVTASALAEELPISRQAIAKHLAALSEAGLVSASQHGRQMRYALTPQPLAEAMRWIADAGARWDVSLDRLSDAISRER